MTVKFNADSLTLNEMALIEELSGKDIADIVGMDVLNAKTAMVLVWIMRRRTEPDLKVEDCGNLTLGELTDFLNGDADPKG